MSASMSVLIDDREAAVLEPLAAFTGTNGADEFPGTPDDDDADGLGGNDLLIGGAGDDKLDGGADVFAFSKFDGNIDRVRDFVEGENGLDLSEILDFGDGDALGDFVDFQSDGDDTIVLIDRDGPSDAEDFEPIARLEDVQIDALPASDLGLDADPLPGGGDGVPLSHRRRSGPLGWVAPMRFQAWPTAAGGWCCESSPKHLIGQP